MVDVKFTWDATKAARNLRGHGVSFEEARTIFYDPHHVVLENYFFAIESEQRYQAIGITDTARVLAVVFVDRSESDDAPVIHIINARKANDYEEQLYIAASQA